MSITVHPDNLIKLAKLIKKLDDPNSTVLLSAAILDGYFVDFTNGKKILLWEENITESQILHLHKWSKDPRVSLDFKKGGALFEYQRFTRKRAAFEISDLHTRYENPIN